MVQEQKKPPKNISNGGFSTTRGHGAMKLKSKSLLLINQYSFIAFGLIILAIVTVSAWRFIGMTYALPVAGLTFVLLVAFRLLLSTRATPYSSVEAFDNARTSGQPVLLVLYSDF